MRDKFETFGLSLSRHSPYASSHSDDHLRASFQWSSGWLIAHGSLLRADVVSRLAFLPAGIIYPDIVKKVRERAAFS